MKISELKQRLINLKDTNFCYQIAENEVNSLYAIILYFMALETNIDTGHTRKLWVQAINRISNVLTKIIPVPNYDIWKNYIFQNSMEESDTINVSYGSFGIRVSSTDEVWKSENKIIAREGNYPKEINAKKNLSEPDSCFNYYKKLIALRNEEETLQFGDIEFADLGKDIFAYYRKKDDKTFFIVSNMSGKAQKIREEVRGLPILFNYRNFNPQQKILRPFESVITRI